MIVSHYKQVPGQYDEVVATITSLHPGILFGPLLQDALEARYQLEPAFSCQLMRAGD